jgi:hypothetical protein
MRLIGLVVALALGQLLLPLRAHGQPAGKVFVLGFLFSQSSAAGRGQDEAFRKGMDELGMLKVVTTRWSVDMPRGAPNCCRVSRRSWSD